MNIESVIPILYSEDVRRSIRFYTEILGFREHWSWDDTPTFGGVIHGDAVIFFCKGDQGHKGTWLAVNVDNVDEFYERVKAMAVEISGPPEDKPWSMRELLLKDPDGHILRVGQNINCD